MNARYWSPAGEPLALMEWAEMFERRSLDDTSWWRVGHDVIGEVVVDTVWFGIDLLSWLDDEPKPRIFESMIMGGESDQTTRNYATWAEAEAGHAELVDMVRSVVT